jgi:gluconokinase
MLSNQVISCPLAVLVMGVSGTGKSTIGRALAETLKAPFLEGDDYHPPANIAKMSAGIALQDDDRWPWLDALGAAQGDAAREHGLAVSACSALKRSYRDRLRLKADVPMVLVVLQADSELIRQRMVARSGHFMPASLLSSQLATLELPDAAEGALFFDCNESADRIVQAVSEQITKRPTDRQALAKIP